MYASCVQALHYGFMPQLNHYLTSAVLPLNYHWRWVQSEALQY